MKCAGSHFFDLPPQESGEAAEEGTACGELLQMAIETPDIWSRMKDGKLTDWPAEMPTHAKNGVAFDDDMKYYIGTMVLPAIIHWQHPANIKCETRIDWSPVDGILLRGQSDVDYIVNLDGKVTLCIDDLKYGWGIVEVRENWQLLGYAIGHHLKNASAGIQQVRMRILQPRPHHEDGWCREWTISVDELTRYCQQITDKFTAIYYGDKSLVTGKHCKYCPAAAEACPAFNRSSYDALETVMTEHIQDVLTDEELSTQLDLFERAKELLDIKFRSIKDLAVSRIKQGKILRNWSTENSYSDRKWKTTISPDTIEMMTGLKIIKQEMVSPAQAEKLGVNKEIVNSLVDRRFLGQKIVRKNAVSAADKIFGTQAPQQVGERK